MALPIPPPLKQRPSKRKPILPKATSEPPQAPNNAAFKEKQGAQRALSKRRVPKLAI